MADSNITKKALANAFKELIKGEPFSKISIGEICDACEMNRKSFYYHFKDKEDLINWIFDNEIWEDSCLDWKYGFSESIEKLIEYFYENKSFYKKIFPLEGQNSFSDHLKDLLFPIFSKRLETIFKKSTPSEFQISFLTDGFIHTIKQWISSQDPLLPHLFIKELKVFFNEISIHICDNIDS